MAITLGTAVTRPDGKIQRAFTQSVAASDEVLVADPIDGRVVVYDLFFTLSVTGTAMLEYGTATPIVGAFTATAGVAYRFFNGFRNPALVCPESESLTITTTTGKADGYIVYDIET